MVSSVKFIFLYTIKMKYPPGLPPLSFAAAFWSRTKRSSGLVLGSLLKNPSSLKNCQLDVPDCTRGIIHIIVRNQYFLPSVIQAIERIEFALIWKL